MGKRLTGFILFITLLVGCQAQADEPFVVPPMNQSMETSEFDSQPVEAALSHIVLYPPPPKVDRYPEEGVRGIYLSEYGASEENYSARAKQLIETTGLNAVVIDYKNDWGRIASKHTSSDELLQKATAETYQAKELIESYQAVGAYTIARIVCFKDAFRTAADPTKAIQNPDGSVFIAPTGDMYLNPFDKSNWDYLVEASIEAAKAGFDEIQYDYVRFPENFNSLSHRVKMDQGDYTNLELNEEQKRSQAIADFVGYAREKLAAYQVRLSVDIFGYVAMVVDDGNVGQNFLMISQNVDAISSMIYPSHWENGAFGAVRPDKEPGKVVSGYIQRELEVLNQLENPPKTRPWLQSFTASYLGAGNYIPYTAKEVQDQIDALRQAGINEYLLWNPSNNYYSNVNY